MSNQRRLFKSFLCRNSRSRWHRYCTEAMPVANRLSRSCLPRRLVRRKIKNLGPSRSFILSRRSNDSTDHGGKFQILFGGPCNVCCAALIGSAIFIPNLVPLFWCCFMKNESEGGNYAKLKYPLRTPCIRLPLFRFNT